MQVKTKEKKIREKNILMKKSKQKGKYVPGTTRQTRSQTPKNIHQQNQDDDKFQPLRTRVATQSLWKAVKILSSEQRDFVESLGLRSLLKMTLDVIP
uniref:Uncharacterized protein n=1 Tax=Lactuca sativa TaxID=4236 RepID=A0A9R1WH86_LACSA|nr:hypothetical protein LSAT_V11C200096090 [Lactuca sativa]